MSHTEYLCKDCKHCFVDFMTFFFSFPGVPDPYTYKCRGSVTESHVDTNPVTGKMKVPKEINNCMTERRLSGSCGPEGRHWIPKRKKDLFKMLTKEHV